MYQATQNQILIFIKYYFLLYSITKLFLSFGDNNNNNYNNSSQNITFKIGNGTANTKLQVIYSINNNVLVWKRVKRIII